jgi:hypothetical protein
MKPKGFAMGLLMEKVMPKLTGTNWHLGTEMVTPTERAMEIVMRTAIERGYLMG